MIDLTRLDEGRGVMTIGSLFSGEVQDSWAEMIIHMCEVQ